MKEFLLDTLKINHLELASQVKVGGLIPVRSFIITSKNKIFKVLRN